MTAPIKKLTLRGNMEGHFELSDSAFIKAFQNLYLDPLLFSHESHLRLAYLHIKKYGIDTAIDNVCKDIIRFVTYHGLNDKFNKTLTIAGVRAVYHFMLKSQTTYFSEFISENLRLKYHFRDLMAAHYGFDIYKDQKAKATYLKPNLLPFD